MGLFSGGGGGIGGALGGAGGALTGGLLGGGSAGNSNSLLSMVPGIGDSMAAAAANAANIEQAKIAREWMERMSNTAYQRSMKDMRKAGLNPMLAYMQGGASVPSASAPTINPESKTGLASAALSAYTGINAAQTNQQNAQTAQASSESSIALQGAQSAQAVAQTEKTQAETAKTIDSIKSEQVKRKLLHNQVALSGVKSSAAELANKGVNTVEKVSDTLLRNTAKPSVDSKTLEYKNPLNPFNWGSEKPKQRKNPTGKW